MEYKTHASRLRSFIPPTKRSKLQWPHKKPSASALAAAGFYFAPKKAGDDNVICFLCNSGLDGWEASDDPIAEHLRHSPECGWAIMMGVMSVGEGEKGIDVTEMEDPTGEAMEEARRQTFEKCGWPHEGKRGWKCGVERMVGAGWWFVPMGMDKEEVEGSEDYASCAYCKLSLDGWEKGDDPFEEHHRRNPECPFFAFAGTTAPTKRGKAKKGRASKVSRASNMSTASARLSTQSNATVQSIPDLDDSIDTSTLSVASNMSKTSTTSKTKRKAAGTGRGGRSKKAKVEPEPEPVAEPETEVEAERDVAGIVEPEAIIIDDTIENSNMSVMSTASTATTKGKKKTARPKTTKAKKGKITRTTKAKKVEPEPEPDPEIEEVAPGEVAEEVIVGEVEEFEEDPQEPEAAHEPEHKSPVQVEEQDAEPDFSSVLHDVPVQPPTTQPTPKSRDLERAAAGSPLQHKSSPYPAQSSPVFEIHAHTSPLGPAVAATSHSSPPAKSPTPSPARSNLENAPPSSLPPSSRPPQPQTTPSRTHAFSSKWSPVDVDLVFAATPGLPAQTPNLFNLAQAGKLNDKEKDMTVQEWIEYMAELAERELRFEAERVVGVFEKQGAKAMGVLEAVECI